MEAIEHIGCRHLNEDNTCHHPDNKGKTCLYIGGGTGPICGWFTTLREEDGPPSTPGFTIPDDFGN